MPRKLKKSIFDELDQTIKALRKASDEEQYGDDEQYGEPDGDEQGQMPPQMQGDEGDEYEDEDEGDEYEDEDEQGAPQMPPMMGKSLNIQFPRSRRERDMLVKSLKSLSYSNQHSKNPVQGTHETHQDNFKEEGIADESWQGQKTYDGYDEGYGGPSPMPPKLMHPKEYEALWNSIMSDGRKGPSITTTTVSNEQAYESKKSFGGDELVDVTPFMKGFDDKLNMLGSQFNGMAQLVNKLGEAQVANSKALAAVMGASQGRRSVATLGKSQGAAAPAPQFSKQQVLPMLEKGVAEGKLSSIELTKFEMTGQMTPGVHQFISTEGGLV